MPFTKTTFSGLLVFKPTVFEDSRGYFFESYNEKTCKEAGVDIQFVQDNQAKSTYGVIRGLHYQLAPFGQTKFIRVLQGNILDVVVDIRIGSPTYGEVFSIELSAENKLQLLIPKGFAHGYSVLSPTAEVFYKCDAFYQKEAEAGISLEDPALSIDWKIAAADRIISPKDLAWPQLASCRNNYQF